MKSKFTFRVATMAFTSLFIAGSAISQGQIKTFPRLNLQGNKLKTMQNDTAHLALFGIREGEHSQMKKGAKSVTYLVDSLFKYSINEGSYKVTHTYDVDGNEVCWLNQIWVINKWTNKMQRVRTFDANGNKLTETGQLWQNNAWVNNYFLTMTYDVNENMTHIARQVNINNAWVNEAQSYYTHDGGGNMLTELFQLWDTTSVAWINNTFDTCTYNGNGKCLIFIEKGWDGANWVNSIHDSSSYDVNGNLIYWLEQAWDGMAWMNNSEEIHTYDIDNNELTHLYNQYWDGADWGWIGLNTYTYDGLGNMLSELQQTWNSSESTWLNWSRYEYTYDANGNRLTYTDYESFDNVTFMESLNEACTYDTNNNLLSSIYQFQCYTGSCVNVWDAEYNYQPGLITVDGNTWTGTQWTTGDVGNMFIVFNDNNFFPDYDNNSYNLVQILVYYKTIPTGINELTESGLVRVYPNPAKDLITIENINPAKGESISIFNMEGQLLIQQNIQQAKTVINISSLAKGVYVIRLSGVDGIAVRKFIKE